MIEVHPATGNLIIVRFRGKVGHQEFTDLPTAISSLEPPDGLRIYFDWLGIDHWPFPTSRQIETWRDAGKKIARAAVVHDSGLNRHAAWLGAVLRSEGVEVRSWRPSHAATAANWLHQATAVR